MEYYFIYKKTKSLGFGIFEVNGNTIVSMSKNKRKNLKNQADKREIELTFWLGLSECFDVSYLDEALLEGMVVCT